MGNVFLNCGIVQISDDAQAAIDVSYESILLMMCCFIIISCSFILPRSYIAGHDRRDLHVARGVMVSHSAGISFGFSGGASCMPLVSALSAPHPVHLHVLCSTVSPISKLTSVPQHSVSMRART